MWRCCLRYEVSETRKAVPPKRVQVEVRRERASGRARYLSHMFKGRSKLNFRTRYRSIPARQGKKEEKKKDQMMVWPLKREF